jgi:hypothetical protein
MRIKKRVIYEHERKAKKIKNNRENNTIKKYIYNWTCKNNWGNYNQENKTIIVGRNNEGMID